MEFVEYDGLGRGEQEAAVGQGQQRDPGRADRQDVAADLRRHAAPGRPPPRPGAPAVRRDHLDVVPAGGGGEAVQPAAPAVGQPRGALGTGPEVEGAAVVGDGDAAGRGGELMHMGQYGAADVAVVLGTTRQPVAAGVRIAMGDLPPARDGDRSGVGRAPAQRPCAAERGGQ